MGGWVDGWMGGWVDGWMGGWVDGWMGGYCGLYRVSEVEAGQKLSSHLPYQWIKYVT